MSFKIAAALDERLDALVDRANEQGANTNRRELLSSLLLGSEGTGEELMELVIRFRRVPVREAILDRELEGNVLDFKAHKPGPRTARSASTVQEIGVGTDALEK